MDFVSLVPLEFCHIGKPLLIGLCGINLPVQKIFGKVLRIFCVSGAATVVIFHGRVYISDPADAEHPLVIDVDTVVMTQVVMESPVALIRTFLMDLLNRIRKTLILCSPLAQLSRGPFVVGRARHMEQFTGQLNGIPFFLVSFPDCGIDMALSHFRKASLLSISSNFFSRSRSISARYS